MTVMGIEISVDKMTVKIPQDKLQAIQQECINIMHNTTRQALQSLLGKLLYVAKIVIPARES